MRHSKGRNGLLLFVMLIAGGVVGNLLGTLAARMLPVLGQAMSFGVSPFTVDLALLTFTFGLHVGINLLGLLGLIIAIIIWLRV
ncbi:MAG: DUF4321 domain-containing protein [Chloroflexota bacterium]